MNIRRSRTRTTLIWLMTALLVIMALFPDLARARGNVPTAESDVLVIAQGLVPVTEGSYSWRVTSGEAGPAQTAERSLGFAVLFDGFMQITNEETGQQSLLNEGQAAFHEEGATETWAGANGYEGIFNGIELVTSTAPEPEGATVDLAGDAFEQEAGMIDLQLVSSIMQPGDAATSTGGELPHMMLMIDGSVTTGDGTRLEAGDAMQVDTFVDLTAGPRGAWWVAGTIGYVPKNGLNGEAGDDAQTIEPSPESEQVGTGSLLLSLYDCDVVTQDGTTENCSPSDDPWEVSLGAGQQQWTNFEGAVDLGNGQYRFVDLPAGEVLINIDPDFDGPIQVAEGRDIYWAGGDGLGTWGVDIVAGQEAEGEAYRGVGDESASDNGSLVLTLYDCTDLDDINGSCQVTANPWEITISRQGGSDTVYSPDNIGNGTYGYTDLIPGTWFVNLDPDFDGPIQVQSGGQVIWGGGDGLGNWVVEITPGEESHGMVYRLVSQVSSPDSVVALVPSGNGDPELDGVRSRIRLRMAP